MARGVDYSSTQGAATAACLKAAGIDFVCRYYDASGGTSAKSLDAAEANSLLAAGLEIFTVYETAPTQVSYFSKAQGRADGTAARAAAQQAGQPPNQAIFFAVDYDASAADIAGPITDYFNGVDEAVAGSFPIGVYGGYPVCAFAKANWPAVTHYWQTVAWSGGQQLPGIDLYQYQTDGMGAPPICGVSVDNNYGYVSGWGGSAGGGTAMTKDEYIKAEADGLSLEDRVKATIRALYAAEIAPALEAEITQRVAAGEQDAVAQAVKAVGKKLSA